MNNKLTKERIKRLIKVIGILLLFTVVPYLIGCLIDIDAKGNIIHIARYTIGCGVMMLVSILIMLVHRAIDYIING